MRKRYVLVNPLWKALASIVDIGYLFYRPAKSFLEHFKFKGKPEAKRIALLVLDHLGDVVFTTPAVSSLRLAYPKAEITVFVGPWARDIYLFNPKVDKVEVFEASWFSRAGGGEGLFSLSRKLKSGNFDLAIDFRGDLRHIFAMWLAKVPLRLGYGITGGGFLLTVKPDYPFEKHAVEKHLTLVEALGLGVLQRSLEVFVSSEARERVEKLLKEKNIEGDFLIIHPGAGSQAKKWPLENFFEVGKKLRDEGFSIVITGSQGEKDEAQNLAESIGSSAVSVAGELSLAELIALISQAQLFIAGDTGPLHLASALGTPFVAVYSGTNQPELWGPWQGNYILLKQEVSCAPCGKKFCSDKKCLALIKPAEVVEKVMTLARGKES